MRLLLCLLIFIPALLAGQDRYTVSATPLDSVVALKAEEFVGIDSYQNLYFIKNKTFIKTNRDKTFQFSDLLLGDISDVDLLNPLRITLFYSESNTAVILDNTLNEITRIKFNEIENFRNVSHVRTASDNQLWIFNTDLQRLELYNYKNKTLQSDFTPQKNNAIALANSFNTCWVLTEGLLYKYNQYGSLLNKQEAKDLTEIQLSEDTLFGLKKGSIYVRIRNEALWIPVKNLPQDVNAFYLNGRILYLYRSDLISTYKLNLPKI